MKTTIITLGIALLTLTNANAKNVIELNVNVITIQNQQDLFDFANNDISEPKKGTTTDEQIIFNPETVFKFNTDLTIEEIIAENNKIIENKETSTSASIFVNTEKTIEEVISENNQIIDSENTTEIRPLYLERTIENDIDENNQIIEGKINTEYLPLDFETINKNSLVELN